MRNSALEAGAEVDAKAVVRLRKAHCKRSLGADRDTHMSALAGSGS